MSQQRNTFSSRLDLVVLICASVLASMTPARLVLSEDVKATAQTKELPHGMSTIRIEHAITIRARHDQSSERSVITLDLESIPLSVLIDQAEVVLTLSTVFDTTNLDSIAPLMVAAFPTNETALQLAGRWSDDWREEVATIDPTAVVMCPVFSSETELEIRLDVTEFVRSEMIEPPRNLTLALMALTTNQSSFHWIRDGRYGGSDAKLEIMYSRND